jgi:hypothetical protein
MGHRPKASARAIRRILRMAQAVIDTPVGDLMRRPFAPLKSTAQYSGGGGL